MTDIYTPFMGPPSRPEKTSSYAKKATAKWNMPESYIGMNEYMRDTVCASACVFLLASLTFSLDGRLHADGPVGLVHGAHRKEPMV
jgi:hypothetical protein